VDVSRLLPFRAALAITYATIRKDRGLWIFCTGLSRHQAGLCCSHYRSSRIRGTGKKNVQNSGIKSTTGENSTESDVTAIVLCVYVKDSSGSG
jgi:hypothetical protein